MTCRKGFGQRRRGPGQHQGTSWGKCLKQLPTKKSKIYFLKKLFTIKRGVGIETQFSDKGKIFIKTKLK